MTDIALTGAITKFEGEHDFLSNFYVGEFVWRHYTYPTAEHAFQAAKGFHIPDSYIDDMTGYMDKIASQPTPAKAKYEGRKVRIDLESWESQKIWYMREIVHAKFAQVPGLAGKLINTGVTMLVEGNTWGDKFWGRVFEDGRWTGLNTLGVILMEERGFWLHGRRD